MSVVRLPAARVLDEDGALVTMRVALGGAGDQVELCGELPHWHAPIAMTPTGGGWYEAALRLGPGVYEYKLSLPGGAWRLDPGQPRTRSVGGARNSVLVVGGTPEPLLHAPAPPWLVVDDDGRLCVRAAVRRGAGSVTLRWSEGGAMAETAMTVVGAEDEHVLLEARLPASGRGLEYLFLVDGRAIGGSDGAALRAAPRQLAPAAPRWWRDAVVYTIFVDRFRRGGGAIDTSRHDREHRAGGDLTGIIEALPYLQELGVTALHLTPISVAASVHRYDAIDPGVVDPALGGDAAFDALVSAAHDRGLRILLDVAITHIDRGFPRFQDVVARGPASPWWPWFRAHRHPFAEGDDPGYQHYQKGRWQEPLLVLEEPEVADWLVETFTAWARRGVDGFRIDAAADAPLPLIARITSAVRAVRRDAAVFAEIVPAGVERWTAHAVDAATDFVGRDALIAWLGAKASSAELAATANRLAFRRGPAGWASVGFTGTHDQPRIATITGDPRAARMALALTLLRAAVPLLYYGDEVGLASDEPGRDFEDSWPDRQGMPWDDASWDHATRAAVRAAIALRRRLHGGEELIALDDDCLLIRRAGVDVIAHRGDGVVTLPITGVVQLALGEVSRDGDQVTLGPWSLVALGSTPDDVDLRPMNAALALRAYHDGMLASPAYPTRLYVTVTEACNLRCAHCITGAPAATASGRARTLQPWLLDALGDAFAHADYVAFTHGGESLAAPIFPDVLAAITRARSGRSGRADIHLVSNGMLLVEDRLRQLIDLGVTSLMVSLDGATAATNDRIRLGGSLEVVVANLRAAVRLRRALGADLRIGVSTVVGRSNLAELVPLARLVADLGLDWLKLEETYPATPFARHDLLAPAAVRDAVAAVADTMASTGIVLVDHVDPPQGCSCDGDPAVASFRAADDFANRVRFAPCRAAWEQAAIDPDGAVHVVDYAAPIAGRLGDADFLSIWNSTIAQRARTRALVRPPDIRRRCG